MGSDEEVSDEDLSDVIFTWPLPETSSSPLDPMAAELVPQMESCVREALHMTRGQGDPTQTTEENVNITEPVDVNFKDSGDVECF